MPLVFAFAAFAAFVGSVAASDSAVTSGPVATSGSVAGSYVGILSKFCIGNNLLLKNFFSCSKL